MYEDRNLADLAEDLAKITHVQGEHSETFDLCPEARCSAVRAVTRRGDSYPGPTAADLRDMGEIRPRAVAGA